jgi:serine/threonine protein phosphatase PrpC
MGTARLAENLEWAFRSRALDPREESGDLHVVEIFPEGALMAVIDGLGHGPEAASAARRAADTMKAYAQSDPVEVVERCHTALRGTRGAALLVLSLSFRDALVMWAGVGNVEGWHMRPAGREALLSRAGVVGYQITAPHRRSAPLTPGDLFILASDGVSARFSESLTRTGRLEEVAEAIFANYARVTDDALVLVARYGEEGGS